MRRPEELNAMLAHARSRESTTQHYWSLAVQQAEAAQHKLLELQTYAMEYQANFAQAVNAGGLVNRKQFMLRLDEAVAQQRRVCQQAHHTVQGALKAWLERQQNVKALETLQQQRQDVLNQERGRVEQRALDDFAIQSVYRR